MKITKFLIPAIVLSASIFGLGLTGAAQTESPSTNTTRVLATCGSRGAAFIFENVDQVPVGCRISGVNSPPAGG